jgi:aromatic-amino-acid transaminase
VSLSDLTLKPADALLAHIQAFRQDPRSHKLNLAVGVYRDDSGRAPVMAAVREAERRLLATQTTKEYLAPEGDARFVDLLLPIIFSDGPPAHIVGVQTVGGTGALRLAGELLAAAGTKRIWSGTPGWLNHQPVFQQAGLAVRTFPMVDERTHRIDIDAMLEALGSAQPGDALLLQACCHNPTGMDFDDESWTRIAEFVASREIVPMLDLAYQGLGDGLQRDAAGVAKVAQSVPYALIAYSCDKNFGLYRERTGALYATGQDAKHTQILRTNILELARANWSMPPDHGAAAVRTILDDPELEKMWREELNTMRRRIQRIRLHPAWDRNRRSIDLSFIRSGKGMFATLPLTATQVWLLRERNGIYMIPTGRINLAGLSDEAIPRLVEALNH